jgi:hypothetical protein
MTLELIGAGFGRTGTLSIYTALNELGFTSYHMVEMVGNRANRRHVDFWREVANGQPGQQFDWEQVFARYRATVDNPGCCVWRELLAAYPDAKVLLTLHPKGAAAWYDSTVETIYAFEKTWQYRLFKHLLPGLRKVSDMNDKLVWQRSLAATLDDRDRAIAHYQRHIDEVKAAVPPERLLVYSADQGWPPLCRFLGVAVPDKPFPRVNDRKAIKHKFRKVALIATLAVILLAALVFWVDWVAIREFWG